MSGDSVRYAWLPEAVRSERVARVAATLTRVVFGGRPGLALFCGALALYVLTWRIGVFFNDIGLYPWMLERLADGHLSLGVPGELGQGYPGMHYRDGRVWGRGYGLVGLALPVYWAVEVLDPLVDLRWLVVVGFSGLTLATSLLVGDLVGHRRRGLAAGVGLGTVALAGNAWFYKPYIGDLSTFALQITTMIAGAVLVVAVYRLLASRHGTTVGLLAGATVLLGTPVAFWASTPKRHTFSAMFVLLAVYAFAASRERDRAPLESAALRGGAYACGGLLAWVHAPEGITLLGALAVVDLPTAPRNDRRTLAVVAGLAGLSLVPYLATNAVVSGNPLLPPHFLDSYHGGSLAELTDGGAAGGGNGGSGGTASAGGSGAAGDATGGSAGSASGGALAAVVGTVAAVAGAVVAGFEAVRPLARRALDMYVGGFVALFTEPEGVFRTFVRWGEADKNVSNLFFDGETNLSVLESAPVLAALVALAPVLGRWGGRVRAGERRLREAVDPVDCLVLVFAALFLSLYLGNLPVQVQGTVRYLHPIYPLAVYGIFRIPEVRSLLTERTRAAALGYEAGVLLGGPVAFGALLFFDASKGGVVQPFGLASLAAAGVLAVALVAGRYDDRARGVAAGAFGVAAAMATVYLLLTSFVLFHYGPSALPAVDALSGEFRWLALTNG
ncbi:hypothetical protein [Halosimplex pelagicum]|uniref:Uncharacterized protein n=1 Tax=Halosimplex pelagicum TaxID=869886 RepID=A0A7D5SUQ8_9EURY|nr:hypothetical protein [Halosimplex pelagicum]QLH81567.1 hypothetical protein HZS54_07975 [Halosimplex pelagicum]